MQGVKEIPDLTLKRIKRFLRFEGIPSSKYIHILGTNGKGEVCVFLETLLLSQDYSVGTFLSPHVFDITERIRINGEKVKSSLFKEVDHYIKGKLKKLNIELTYFEKVFVIALEIFKREKLDFIILEAGLGGRLDATSVIKPVLTIFTPISIDHQEFLGKKLKEISREKAEAIKRNSFVVTNNKGIPLKVIKKYCKKRKAKLFVEKNTTKMKFYKKFKVLFGKYLNTDFKKENFKLSFFSFFLLAKLDFIKISNFNLKKLEIKDFYGRFDEFFINDKKIVVDSAHNVSGAEAISREIKNKKGNILILAMLKEKDVSGFLRKIVKKFDIIILSENKSFRKEKAFCHFLRVENFIFKLNKKIIVMPDLKKAIKEAIFNIKGDLLITGSFYTSSIALKELKKYVITK